MPTKRRSVQKRRPLQQRSRETIEVIVRATAQILSREGMARVTTNHVAEKAGVSVGSIYQYFPDKEALVAEVRRRYDEAFRERMLALVGSVATLPLADAIERCVRAMIAVHADDTGLHNAVSAAGIAEPERRLLHQVAASWLDAHRDEVRRPDRTLAAAVALDVVEGIIHGVALRDPARLVRDEFAVEVTDMLVRYLVR
jgi:AcrR family transcriptional regulator